MRIARMPLALLLTVGLAVPLSAQEGMHGRGADSASRAMSCGMGDMMGMMGGMQGGGNAMMRGGGMMMSTGRVMMDAMRYMPRRVLALADSLGLSKDQVTQIEALRPTGGMMMHAQPDSAAVAALEQAFDADRPNADAVRQAAERALQQHVRGMAGRIAAAAAVRGALTPAQRERLAAIVQCPAPMMQGGGPSPG